MGRDAHLATVHPLQLGIFSGKGFFAMAYPVPPMSHMKTSPIPPRQALRTLEYVDTCRTKALSVALNMIMLMAALGVIGLLFSQAIIPSQPLPAVAPTEIMLSLGIGMTEPRHPVVFTGHDGASWTELYRLHTDGSEWYAPGISPAWVKGRLFQLRCPARTICL